MRASMVAQVIIGVYYYYNAKSFHILHVGSLS